MNWDILTDIASLAGLRQEWRNLAQKSDWHHIEGSPDWIICWWNTLARHDVQLAAIVVRNGAQLAAVLPMMVRARSVGRYAQIRRLQPVGTGLTDYLYPLYVGDPGTIAKAIVAACTSLQKRWDELWFCQFPATAPLTIALHQELGKCGYDTRTVASAGCPIVDTTGRTEDYFASRSKQLRQNFNTQSNKLKRAELKPSVQCRFALTNLLMDELRTIEADKKQGRKIIGHPTFSQFISELFDILGTRGECEIWTAHLDGKAESFAVTVTDGRMRGYWHVATSVRGSEFSLGTYLLHSIIRSSFEQGYCEFDFLRGMEPYKMRWATGVRDLSCFGTLSNSWRTRILLLGNLALHRVARKLTGKADHPSVLVEEFGDI